MKRVLILGANGMLGRMVLDYLASYSNFRIDAFARNFKTSNELRDIYNSVEFLFDYKVNNYDYIINCIGVIKPRINENDQDSIYQAVEGNIGVPRDLFNSMAKCNSPSLARNTKVIQIATDCVYDGKKGSYIETDKHNPDDVYGKTKSIGEVKDSRFYNLRCSIIGPEFENKYSLLEWVLKQSDGSAINGFTNHDWNGVTTLEYAKVVKNIIENDVSLPNVQHLVPADKVTKFQLVSEIAHLWGKNLVINPVEAKDKIDRTLSTNNAENVLKAWGKNPPTIFEMLKELCEYNVKTV